MSFSTLRFGVMLSASKDAKVLIEGFCDGGLGASWIVSGVRAAAPFSTVTSWLASLSQANPSNDEQELKTNY